MRFLFLIFLFISCISYSQKQKVWLDADTGNEMDDLYAIVQLLKSNKIEVVGLSSAHFNNADLVIFDKWNSYDAKSLHTVSESQRLNEEILKALNMLNLPHPKGSDRQIGRAWGQEDPRPNPASSAIIDLAKRLKAGEKLDIITLGPLTNVAQVLIEAPEVKNKIRVYSLGAKYEPKKKIWNKSEFNIRNDLNAFDYLLNLDDLDFTIMPLEASFPLQFKREFTYQMLDEKIEIQRILKRRWMEQNPQDETRVMWDLAMVAAYLFPEKAKMKLVNKPVENKKGKVKVYTWIDHEWIANKFWETIKD